MNKNQIKSYCVIGVIAAAVYLFVMNAGTVFGAVTTVLAAASPLFVGMIIAYVLNILLKKIERVYFPKSRNSKVITSRRPVSIVLAFVALGMIIAFLFKLVVPELGAAIKLMAEEIPPAVEAIRLWAIDNSGELPAIQAFLENLNVDWQATMKKILEVVAVGAGGIFASVMTVVGSIFGTVTKLLIGTIFAIYLLSSKETLSEQADNVMRAYLRPETRAKILYVLKTVHDTFTSFIVGQVTEAVVIGALCALGMTLLRMPYAVMTGAVVGVTALIPVVGAYIGAAVGAFMVFTVNPVQAIVFVIFLVILQQLEGNLIYPKVVGSSIGLPGLWVLAAVTIGGGVFGIPGMLFGVPLTASVYKLVDHDVNQRISQNKE